ncbi:MAG: hypothetical protein QOG71_2254 [Pyrinomonadaceae bacterium]|nr:hypothetical protein [Pyrinomonadaceae bacterium]
MNEEQWKELLELRAKASLSPRTDSRFERLEDYISLSLRLSIYSHEEQLKLLAEFNELPDQEKQDVLSRVANRTHPNFLQLSADELEKLRTARKDLSFHERARLFSDLFLTAAGTAWLDLGGVFEAEIEINDNSSPERETRPYAYIYFSHGHHRRVETIDILESIKRNPESIGHPAIVFAIHHWQRVIYAKRVIERDDVTTRDEIGKVIKEMFGGKDIKTAKRNLGKISKTLVDAAKKRAISNELAFAFKIESVGLGLENKETFLYKAWEKLEAEFVGQTDGVEQILAKIETELLALERRPYTGNRFDSVSVRKVMEFLRKAGKKGGKKFVGYNAKGNLRRPRWKVFRNAYAAWLFGLKQSLVSEYLRKAAKQELIESDVYQPSWVSPKGGVIRIIHHLMTTPLVAVRNPVIISEDNIGFQGIEAAIKKAMSDSDGEDDYDEEGWGN